MIIKMEKLLENLKEAIKHYEDCMMCVSDEDSMKYAINRLRDCCDKTIDECNNILDED